MTTATLHSRPSVGRARGPCPRLARGIGVAVKFAGRRRSVSGQQGGREVTPDHGSAGRPGRVEPGRADEPPGFLLELRQPGQPPRQVLVNMTVEVGRVSPQFTVDDPEVSRRHLLLEVAGHSLRVTDLGSSNGTAVNGSPVTGTIEVRPGDVVELGHSHLIVVSSVGGSARPAEQRAERVPKPRPALEELAVRETEAAVFRFRPGSPGEAAVADLIPAVDRARRALAGLGSEPWGVRPQICLVDPFPDPSCPGEVVAQGTIVDPVHAEIWMAVTAESPPEAPARPLALLFGAPLPAAPDLALLLEGYGLAVSELNDPDPDLEGKYLPALTEVEGETRSLMALSFVRYLLERAGRETFLRLLSTAAPGRVDEAATEAYGVGLSALEEAWRRKLNAPQSLHAGLFLRTAAPYLRLNLRREIELSFYLLIQLSFSVVFPFALQRLLRDALPEENAGLAVQVIVFVTAVFAVSLLAGVRAGYLGSYISASVVRRVRNDMFGRMQGLSASWFARQQQGDVLSRLTNDVSLFEAGMSQALRQGVFQLLSLIAATIVVLRLNLTLGLIVVLGALLVGLAYKLMSPRAQRRSVEVQEQFGSLLSVAAENFAAHFAIRVFGLERYEQRRFHRAADHLFTRQLRLAFFGALFTISVSSIVTGVQLGVLAAGAWLVFNGDLDAGTYVVVLTQIGQVIGPVTALSTVGQQIQQASGALLRINEVLATAPAVTEPADAVELAPMTRDITFADVDFSYSPERPTLSGINVTIPAGFRVAFVGPTGAGKSALLQLLLRIYDVDRGAIMIDGVDIRDASIASLRRQFGVVLQDTFLFDASIRDNIALRAQLPDEEIYAAARVAQIHDYVMSLPRGYDTRVGERGARLSGGQRQRLAIARALLRQPRVIVLDEATSALDPVTELRILESLDAASEGRTTVAVTHRLASVTRFDHIFVVNEGRIVEGGTHEDLLDEGGVYADMWSKQTGHQGQLPPSLNVIEALGRIPIFRDLSPAHCAEVAGRLKGKPLAPGEGVPEGDGCLYLVAEGEVRLSGPQVRAADSLVVLRQGDAFGVSALLQGGSGTILEAVGPAQLLVLDAEDVAHLAATIPAVAAALAGSSNLVAPAGGSRLASIPWGMAHSGAGFRRDDSAPMSRRPMSG